MNNTNLISTKESFLIFCDSRNGIVKNPGWNSDVVFAYEGSLYFDKDDYVKICFSLNNFICPNSIYNINEYNNVLMINFNNTITSYNIPFGNYNIKTFVDYLTTVLPLNFTITYSLINNKITFTNSTYEFSVLPSNIYEIIGLDINTTYSSINKTLTCPYCCNFNGVQTLNVCVMNINTQNLDSFTKTQSNIICSIPVDLTSPVIKYVKGEDYELPMKVNFLDDIYINIVDDQNRLINLNNKHFNLSLEFSILKLYNPFQPTFNEIFYED